MLEEGKLNSGGSFGEGINGSVKSEYIVHLPD